MTRCFLDNLKVGMVYPIHKGDSDMACTNYTPISILPLFSKLLHKRLSDNLNIHNILYDNQLGFQKENQLGFQKENQRSMQH